jgi:hypothetical protein
MTRTPTTFVTAIAIAARAFAGEFPSGAHFPGFWSGRRCRDLSPAFPPGSAGIGIRGFPAFRFSPGAIDRRPRFCKPRPEETKMNDTDKLQHWFRRNFDGLWLSASFRRLWLSLTVTSFGAQITNLALPLTAALLLNATPMQMGILVALETLPFALFSLHAGVLLDRVRKLPVIIAADVGRGIALLAIPVAAWFGLLSMEILFAVGFLCGMQNVVGGAAYQVLLAQMGGPQAPSRGQCQGDFGRNLGGADRSRYRWRADPCADRAVRDRARCDDVLRLCPDAAPDQGAQRCCARWR